MRDATAPRGAVLHETNPACYTRIMTDDTSVDIELEADEEMGDAAAAQAKLKKLRAELKDAQAKAAENLAGWQREKADAINARKDAMRDAARATERAIDAFVEDILPALDSFDMAMGAASWETVSEDWRAGMNHIRNQLLEVLQKNGVARVGKVGEAFDPRMHEAVQEVDDMAGDSHTIVRVLRSGYAAGERLIRPAQVIIKK